MAAYTVISIVIIVLLAAVAIRSAREIFLERDRNKRITSIRNYKKGKCLSIFLIAMPLFFIGFWYDRAGSEKYLDEIISATISGVTDLVVLRFSYTGIRGLMLAKEAFSGLFYTIAVYLADILVLCNAVLFGLSVGAEYLWEWRSRRAYRHCKGNRYIFIGDNEGSRKLYISLKDGKAAFVGEFGGSEKREDFYKAGICFFDTSDERGFIKGELDKCSAGDFSRLTVIVNTQDEEENAILGSFLSEAVSAAVQGNDRDRLYDRIRIYIFGSEQYESIYAGFANPIGSVRIVDKYKKLAIDFENRYPLAGFLTDRHIDRETSLVRDETEIDVIFIGFGDLNKSIMQVMSAAEQFAAGTVERPAPKLVRYHIFDKDRAEWDKNLNHGIFRYQNEFYRSAENGSLSPAVDESRYLPLPPLPFEAIYHHTDFNAADFYYELREALAENKTGIHNIIISCGSDLVNYEMAIKLSEKVSEWGAEGVELFVRFRESHKDLENQDMHFFGDEGSILYSMEAVDELSSDLLKISLRRNRIYALSRERQKAVGDKRREISSEKLSQIEADADKVWYVDWNQSRRDSSNLATLGIRSKLLMMGLDYEKKSEGRRYLSYNEYMEIYADDDRPDMGADGREHRSGKYFKPSRAKAMAYIEHLRWNAYMLGRGFVPATIDEIINETDENGKHTNGRNYHYRRHGNLTTFDGLYEYSRLVSERDGVAVESADVIAYDYAALDSAWRVLDEAGFGIFRVGIDDKEI